jgi:hypothetical protein
MDCLGKKVLEYAIELAHSGHKPLKRQLQLRFEVKDAPATARRQVHAAKQREDEGLE